MVVDRKKHDEAARRLRTNHAFLSSLARLGVDADKLPKQAKDILNRILDGDQLTPAESAYFRGEIAELRRPR